MMRDKTVCSRFEKNGIHAGGRPARAKMLMLRYRSLKAKMRVKEKKQKRGQATAADPF